MVMGGKRKKASVGTSSEVQGVVIQQAMELDLARAAIF